MAFLLDEAGGDQPAERLSLIHAEVGVKLDRKWQVRVHDAASRSAERERPLRRLVAEDMNEWLSFHDALVGGADRRRPHALRYVEPVEGDDKRPAEHVLFTFEDGCRGSIVDVEHIGIELAHNLTCEPAEAAAVSNAPIFAAHAANDAGTGI